MRASSFTLQGHAGVNAAANSTTCLPSATTNSGLTCAVHEQAETRAAAAAVKNHDASQNDEKQACQLHQDIKDFSLDAHG